MFLRPDKANRCGLITGATGTGKTVTLQTMTEGFSRLGVPEFEHRYIWRETLNPGISF